MRPLPRGTPGLRVLRTGRRVPLGAGGPRDDHGAVDGLHRDHATRAAVADQHVVVEDVFQKLGPTAAIRSWHRAGAVGVQADGVGTVVCDREPGGVGDGLPIGGAPALGTGAKRHYLGATLVVGGKAAVKADEVLPGARDTLLIVPTVRFHSGRVKRRHVMFWS